MTLPQWPGSQLDIGKLSRIFDATTTTYKHWFFLSLLDFIPWDTSEPQSSQGQSSTINQACNRALNQAFNLALNAYPGAQAGPGYTLNANLSQTANPWDIPLTLVLWHMLELSFQAVSEFHVHFPFFDRLPVLISQVHSVLQCQEQALTTNNLQHSLAILGRAIFQDQCLNRKSPNWPIPQASIGLALPKATLSPQATITQGISVQSTLAQDTLAQAEPPSQSKTLSVKTPSQATSQVLPDYVKFLKDFSDLEKYVIYRLLSPWIGSQDTLARFNGKDQLQGGSSSSTGNQASDMLLEDELILPYKIGQLQLDELDNKWQPQVPLTPANTLFSSALALLNDDWDNLGWAGSNLGGASLDEENVDVKRGLNLKRKVKVVRLNPLWVPYLQKHKEILQAFTYQKLASKLEVLNPLMPALLAKLLPQNKREALTAQRAYFNAFLQHQQLTNIYTGQNVSLQDDFALDHFLPWSFVHHDLIWNLTPISRELNSSKSNQLPDPALISRLSDQQLELLRFHVAQGQSELKRKSKVPAELEDNFLGAKFNAFISDFLELGQGRSIYELSQCTPREFYSLLAAQLEPAIKIAQNQGFTSWQAP